MKLKVGQVWRKRGKYQNIYEVISIANDQVDYMFNKNTPGHTSVDVLLRNFIHCGYKLELLETFKNLKDKHD